MKVFNYTELLLLALNYDTNVRNVLTLTERCLIHKTIHRSHDLPKVLVNKLNELLEQLLEQQYRPKFYTWVECEYEGGFILQQSKLKETWNFLK